MIPLRALVRKELAVLFGSPMAYLTLMMIGLVTALIGLLIPERSEELDDGIASREGSDAVGPHDVAFPGAVLGEAIGQEIAIALVVAPAIQMHPLGDGQPMGDAVGIDRLQRADRDMARVSAPAGDRLRC